MYLLSFCESSGVLRLFYILKISLSIVLTILPIIVIIAFMMNAFKAVVDGKSDSLKNIFIQNVKRLLAALIVFLIPSMLNFIFTTLVSIEVDFASCWTNATLDGIESASINEEQSLKEEREERQEELLEAGEDREAIESARNEVIKQSREEYNTGGGYTARREKAGGGGYHGGSGYIKGYSYNGTLGNNTTQTSGTAYGGHGGWATSSTAKDKDAKGGDGYIASNFYVNSSTTYYKVNSLTCTGGSDWNSGTSGNNTGASVDFQRA